VDTFTVEASDGDVYLLCSDGLTSMVGEARVGEILRKAPDITTAAEQLVAAALDAGGRDNGTVVLFRVENIGSVEDPPPTQELRTVPEPASSADEAPTAPESAVAAAAPAEPNSTGVGAPPSRLDRRAPRMPRGPAGAPRRRSRLRRRLALSAVVLIVLGAVAVGGLLATQAVYFIGTDANGQVTVYNGIPYTLPGGVRLYTRYFVSGVTVAELSALERRRLFNNELRSQRAATHLVSQLELGRIAGQ
jgi:PPM family protein phosphatase